MRKDPFPTALKTALKGKYTQATFAKRLNISVGYLSDLINGKRRGGDDLRRNIAEELGYLDYEAFLDIGREKIGVPPVRSDEDLFAQKLKTKYGDQAEGYQNALDKYRKIQSMTIAELKKEVPEVKPILDNLFRQLIIKQAIERTPPNIAKLFAYIEERYSKGDFASVSMGIFNLAYALNEDIINSGRLSKRASEKNTDINEASMFLEKNMEGINSFKEEIILKGAEPIKEDIDKLWSIINNLVVAFYHEISDLKKNS